MDGMITKDSLKSEAAGSEFGFISPQPDFDGFKYRRRGPGTHDCLSWPAKTRQHGGENVPAIFVITSVRLFQVHRNCKFNLQTKTVPQPSDIGCGLRRF